MILSFKERFKEKILSGVKIHTIREDKGNRWVKGRFIHFATGVRTKNYCCFKTAYCTCVQRITIDPVSRKVKIVSADDWFEADHEHTLSRSGVAKLAKNDGFDTTKEFWEWFNRPTSGKIIHWSEFRYF